MAEVQQPVVATEAPVVEPTPVPAAVLDADKPAEAVEPTVEEPTTTEGEAVAPVVEEKKEEPPVEPIYSGALGYKAPGLKNVFRFSKKYFWFGEEPVPASSLNQFLRGEKDTEYAHTVAAWSSVTGKGLLFYVKHADQKETPAGVLKLSEATDITKDGSVAFFFKLHGHKHAFEAHTTPERNGWFIAVEKAVEDAKAASEGIVAHETYAEQITKLGKPTALAAAANTSSSPKKSIDATPKLAETEAPTTEAAAPVPARTGSASSSSSDEERKRNKAAAKSKSRSVSRNKRASIFGGFLGKKEKSEEKKEEELEAKKDEETAVAPVAEASTAPVVTPVLDDAAKPVDEAKPAEETSAPVVAPVVQDKPKPVKRASIFGNFVEKLKSPTTEKKESELVPAPISKEADVSADAPKIEEPVAPIVPVTDVTTDASKAEEAKPVAATTPHKEKSPFSFGKFLGGAKDKTKSPTTEKVASSEAPKLEDPVTADEAPVLAPIEPVTPVEPVVEAPKDDEAPTGVTSTATATPPTQKKRGSIFGNLTGGSVKKEKDGEASEKPKGLSGLFRSGSKATKAKKEDKTATPPSKVDETAEPKEEVPVTEEQKLETPSATEPQSIGDVTPDAVTVGQAPKSTPQVATSA